MAQVMMNPTKNLEFDTGSFWPADAFKGDDVAFDEIDHNDEDGNFFHEDLEGQEPAARQRSDWKNDNKSKLQSIIKHRRDDEKEEEEEAVQLLPPPDSETIQLLQAKSTSRRNNNFRRSRSHGNSETSTSRQAAALPPLRRTRSRDASSPIPSASGGGSRRHRDHHHQRSSPRSPVATANGDRKGRNPREKSPQGGGAGAGSFLHPSSPRKSPIMKSMEDQKDARRRMMLKRNNSLRGRSLRGFVTDEEEAPSPNNRGKDGDDDINIDEDAVPLLKDGSDADRLRENSGSSRSPTTRRGQLRRTISSRNRTKARRSSSWGDGENNKQSSLSSNSKSPRGELRSSSNGGGNRDEPALSSTARKSRRHLQPRSPSSNSDEDKEVTDATTSPTMSRRNRHGSSTASRHQETTKHAEPTFRRTKTTGTASRRDHVRRSNSDKKPGPGGRRTSLNECHSSSFQQQQQGEEQQSKTKVQKMKELGKQHQKARKQMKSSSPERREEDKEEEIAVEEEVLPVSSRRKSRSDNRTISGIESLANASFSRNNRSQRT